MLLVVYVFGLTLAALELSLPKFQLEYLTLPEALLKPETNIADVSSVLYPDRAYSFYFRALQAEMCAGPRRKTPPECRKRAPVKPHEIRELIERSLATGNRSIEMAMYNYAFVLLQENAASELVDEAIREWRFNYPQSPKTDPREMYRQMSQSIQGGRRIDDGEFEDRAK